MMIGYQTDRRWSLLVGFDLQLRGGAKISSCCFFFLRIQGQTGSNLRRSVPPLLLPGVSYCLVPSRLWSDAALLVSPNLNRRTPVPYPKELETGTKGEGE